MNHRNRILRDVVSKLVEAMPPGEILKSCKVAEELSTRSRFADNRTIAAILREREDLEKVSTGIWRRRL